MHLLVSFYHIILLTFVEDEEETAAYMCTR